MRPTPKDVFDRLDRLLALPGAYRKKEAEDAAALIICTLAELQSDWAPVKIDDVLAFVDEHADDPRFRIFYNPFFRPNPHELARRGFASLAEGFIELTDNAIERACVAVGLQPGCGNG